MQRKKKWKFSISNPILCIFIQCRKGNISISKQSKFKRKNILFRLQQRNTEFQNKIERKTSEKTKKTIEIADEENNKKKMVQSKRWFWIYDEKESERNYNFHLFPNEKNNFHTLWVFQLFYSFYCSVVLWHWMLHFIFFFLDLLHTIHSNFQSSSHWQLRKKNSAISYELPQENSLWFPFFFQKKKTKFSIQKLKAFKMNIVAFVLTRICY